jgi:hypothetical protein
MAKAAKKTTRTAAKKTLSHQKRTAKAIASAIVKARKASGKRGADDADIHVHVGDVVMMGFDEAVDAEEWGARETNNEISGGKGRRGRSAREADPQDEKNRKVHRTITLRKGAMKLQAVEKSQPSRKKKAAKKSAKKSTRRR